jgi:hypothetical protein
MISANMAKAAVSRGDRPIDAPMMSTMAPKAPITAPATGKAREARLRSKLPERFCATGSRVRNAAALRRSSRHSAEDH